MASNVIDFPLTLNEQYIMDLEILTRKYTKRQLKRSTILLNLENIKFVMSE